MTTKQLFYNTLTINKEECPILFYLALLDEEMLEFRLKKTAKEILWSGDMLVIVNTVENELSKIEANNNMSIARDWLNGKEVF
jgi:hypothetical protein